MPGRCVAAGCSNTTKDGVSLHKFPTDEKCLGLWIKNVRLPRPKWSGPTEHTVLCSDHFDPSCFDKDFQGLFSSFGMKRNPKLQADAVPTRFALSKKARASPAKKRAAFSKREKMRTLVEAFSPPTQPEPKRPCVVSAPSRPMAAAEVDQPELPGCCDSMSGSSSSDTDSTDSVTSGSPWLEDAFSQTDPLPNIGLKVDSIDVSTQTDDPKPTSRPGCSCKCRCVETDMPLVESVEVEAADIETADIDETVMEDCDIPAEKEEQHGDNDQSSDYIPSSSSSVSSDDMHIAIPKRRGRSPRTVLRKSEEISAHEEAKYIVFESALMTLFKRCRKCGSRQVENLKRVVGTYLAIDSHCKKCSASNRWESQPWFSSTPAGNVLLSGAILFAGASPVQVLRVLNSMGVTTHVVRTYFSHQATYLIPAVETIWIEHINRLRQTLHETGRKLVIGGDGRADSPGHSAKYGSYTAMELQVNKIVDIQLVQSNEVKSSYHMEMEGFKRMMKTLKEAGLSIGKVVTDRHRSLAKHIRENEKDVLHMFDVWHVAKGLKKKVDKLAMKKGYEDIGDWKRSINNHVYWCASSTRDEESELREVKWLSISNHVQNKHEGHSPLFPKCLHGNLRKSKKIWLEPGIESTEKLVLLLTNKALLKDMRQISTTSQTSSVEAFHSLFNMFAPKSKAYSYAGILTRLRIAALHYNTNSDRNQAVTYEGIQKYNLSRPKYKYGEATVKPIMEPPSTGYVKTLFEEMTRRCRLALPSSDSLVSPPPLSSKYPFPDKRELIAKHRSRFQKLRHSGP